MSRDVFETSFPSRRMRVDDSDEEPLHKKRCFSSTDSRPSGSVQGSCSTGPFSEFVGFRGFSYVPSQIRDIPFGLSQIPFGWSSFSGFSLVPSINIPDFQKCSTTLSNDREGIETQDTYNGQKVYRGSNDIYYTKNPKKIVAVGSRGPDGAKIYIGVKGGEFMLIDGVKKYV